jgi:hypothetical protein|tara:strand:- start:2476 stop:2580 length:105 start_codon:yes stop_codon:yes gene_type:complete
MKEKINQIKELFGAIGVFFILTCLQIWYIITGNE